VSTAFTAVIAVTAAHSLFGIGGRGLDAPIRDLGSSVVYILVALVIVFRTIWVRESRSAWIVIAAGISAYGTGNVVWSSWLEHVADPPIPSICDVLWLAFYPTSYVGVLLLARRQWRGLPAGVWLDGIVAGLGITTIGAAIVFEPVLASTSGRFFAVATNLAYPIADLGLAALIAAVLSLRGWRIDRAWMLLGAGFLTLTAADSIYLLGVANGSSAPSGIANLTYLVGVALIALGAWQPPERSALARTEHGSSLLVSGGFAVAAIGVLTYSRFAPIGTLPFALALLTVLASGVRIAFAFRDLRTYNEARRQAVTDDLTGLPNRRLFQRRLEETIARTGGGREGSAVLILGLNRFKDINDTLGYQSGDELLCQIGPRLGSILQPADTVARLGGDEFGVVLHKARNKAEALATAHGIHAVLEQPFQVQDLALRVEATVGIALFPANGETAVELLRHADVAMHEAKKSKTSSELYDLGRDTKSPRQLSLATELAQAIGGEEIEVYYQPQADANTHQILAVEALVRWRHPVLGLLQPLDFIPLAETTGLIRRLTGQVMDIALAQCATWRQAGFDVYVSINVSASDLLDADLPQHVAAALKRHGLPATALVIELTESSVLADPVRIHGVLTRLDQLGVGLSLDDFGTGFSSLAHLKTLPVDELKIDKSFVTRMTSNPADSAIVDATIGLARRLGKRIVAEGVEDHETWKSIATAGCHLVQGFVLSPPAQSKELETLLNQFETRIRPFTSPTATAA
jgi:diguanylate cyclase